MRDLEPFRAQVLLDWEVLASQEVTHDFDAQHEHGHIAELDRTKRDVRHLLEARQQRAPMLLAAASVRASAQLSAGASHDPRDEGFGSHPLEGVEDIWKQGSEADEREDSGAG